VKRPRRASRRLALGAFGLLTLSGCFWCCGPHPVRYLGVTSLPTLAEGAQGRLTLYGDTGAGCGDDPGELRRPVSSEVTLDSEEALVLKEADASDVVVQGLRAGTGELFVQARFDQEEELQEHVALTVARPDSARVLLPDSCRQTQSPALLTGQTAWLGVELLSGGRPEPLVVAGLSAQVELPAGSGFVRVATPVAEPRPPGPFLDPVHVTRLPVQVEAGPTPGMGTVRPTVGGETFSVPLVPLSEVQVLKFQLPRPKTFVTPFSTDVTLETGDSTLCAPPPLGLEIRNETPESCGVEELGGQTQSVLHLRPLTPRSLCRFTVRLPGARGGQGVEVRVELPVD